MRGGIVNFTKARMAASAARKVCLHIAVCILLTPVSAPPSQALDLPTCPLNPTMEDCRILSSEFLSITRALYDRLSACKERSEVHIDLDLHTSCSRDPIVYPRCFDTSEQLCQARMARDREMDKCRAKAWAAFEKERQEKRAQREEDLKEKIASSMTGKLKDKSTTAGQSYLENKLQEFLGRTDPALAAAYKQYVKGKGVAGAGKASWDLASGFAKLGDSNQPFMDRYNGLSGGINELMAQRPGLANQISTEFTEFALDEYGNIANAAIAEFDQAVQQAASEYMSYQQSVNQIEVGLREDWEQNAAAAKAKVQDRLQAAPRPSPPSPPPQRAARQDPRCGQARQQVQAYQNYLRNSLPASIRNQVIQGMRGAQSWIQANCR